MTSSTADRIDPKALFEGVRAFYDQVDASVSAVERKANVWLGVVSFLLGSGTVSLGMTHNGNGGLWATVPPTLLVGLLVVLSWMAISRLLSALGTDEYEGLVEPEKLVRDYEDAPERTYYREYARYLAEASHSNERRLLAKARDLREAILWTRGALGVFMALTLTLAGLRIWS